jgi:hypothetical protein
MVDDERVAWACCGCAHVKDIGAGSLKLAAQEDPNETE